MTARLCVLIVLLASPVWAQGKWPAGSELAYTIHPDNWDLPLADVVAASQAADAIVNAMPAGQPRLRYTGLSSQTPLLGNGRNELYALPGGDHAADGNVLWDSSYVITEGDVKFWSGAYVFRMAGDPACTRNNIDVNFLAILVHEKLHTLGLVFGAGTSNGHFSPAIAGATMNALMPSSCGREWESPEAADLAALRAVYPITQLPNDNLTRGVRPLRFMFVTYPENRGRYTNPTQLATNMLNGLNTAKATDSYGKLQFTGSSYSFDSDISSAGCPNFNSYRASLVPLMPPIASNEILAWVWYPRAGVNCGTNTTRFDITLNAQSALQHEIGHIIRGVSGEGDALARNGTAVSEIAYGDALSVMGGSSNAGHPPPDKERMGWFDSARQLQVLLAPQTVTLARYDTQTAGVKAVKYRKFAGMSGPTPVYFDYYLNYYTSGVALRDSNYLLDLDPFTSARKLTLLAGESHTEDGITYRVLSATPTEAVVNISLASSTPAPRAGGKPILKES